MVQQGVGGENGRVGVALAVRRDPDRADDHPAAGQQPRVEHHGVDPVQPAQRLGVHRQHPGPGQVAVHAGGESLPAELGGLRIRRRGRRHHQVRVAGRRQRRRRAGQRPGGGLVAVGLDRPGRQRHRPLAPPARRPRTAGRLAARQAGRPASAPAAATDRGARAVRRAAGRAGRCPRPAPAGPRQALRDGVADGQAQIRRGPAEPALDRTAQHRRRLDQREERRRLADQRVAPRQPAELPEDELARQPEAQAAEVGADRVQLALDRLGVGRMIGPVMRETLVRQVVGILDALDDVADLVDADLVPVERDDDPAGDGVDLSPLNPVNLRERPFQRARGRVVLRPVNPPDLDMRAPVADPAASLAAAGRDRQPAGDSSQDRARLRDHQLSPSGQAGARASGRRGRDPDCLACRSATQVPAPTSAATGQSTTPSAATAASPPHQITLPGTRMPHGHGRHRDPAASFWLSRLRVAAARDWLALCWPARLRVALCRLALGARPDAESGRRAAGRRAAGFRARLAALASDAGSAALRHSCEWLDSTPSVPPGLRCGPLTGYCCPHVPGPSFGAQVADPPGRTHLLYPATQALPSRPAARPMNSLCEIRDQRGYASSPMRAGTRRRGHAWAARCGGRNGIHGCPGARLTWPGPPRPGRQPRLAGERGRAKRPAATLVALILVAAVANLNLSVANVALPAIGSAFDSPRPRST